MRIGELASRTGVSVRALRYYEEQALLAPQRTAAGQRLYGPEDEGIVAIIRDLLGAGFCSSVIAALLPALREPEASADELRDVVEAAEHRLTSEKRAIEQELEALAALRHRWGLASHVHVREETDAHDEPHHPETASADHRDRRLRRSTPLLP
ncbi:MerR family transcriptional regulator [Marisediminicola sp. LYQ85]|uniref:MerR family transcriptional regulator n=1 Tax=Marisediminicola sp. LYQ85 TaxID=3391062 RepID=UPI00398316D7